MLMSKEVSQKEDSKIMQLIEEHKGIIISICHAFCKERTDQDDLAQEIIIRIWEGYHHYQTQFKFSTWMYRVALNVAISYNRNNQKWKDHIILSESSLEEISTSDEKSSREESLQLLYQKVSALKPIDKALMLLYFEEKSYKEISEIIGITETNVATRIGRIKERLKQDLQKTSNKIYGR
jgi:RNA polymerase sigma-70 factor (ECF subfamily)